MKNFGNLFSQLNKFRSWKLERISHTTFPHDITIKLKYLTAKDVERISNLIKGKSCYRCRIGTGKFFFGSTMSEAIEAAVANEK